MKTNHKLAKRIRGWVDRIAYISLFFDIVISILTLFSNGQDEITLNITNIRFYTNWGLTIIIILAFILTLCLLYLKYEHRILKIFGIEKK